MGARRPSERETGGGRRNMDNAMYGAGNGEEKTGRERKLKGGKNGKERKTKDEKK